MLLIILKNGGYFLKNHLTNGYLVHTRVMMFNATFNNISVLSWRSVLFVEETGAPGENDRPVASY
jgi:hypothetical protein